MFSQNKNLSNATFKEIDVIKYKSPSMSDIKEEDLFKLAISLYIGNEINKRLNVFFIDKFNDSLLKINYGR